MSARERQRQRATAVHEAGHVVMAHTLGVEVQCVNAEYDGGITNTAPCRPALRLVIALAGHEATTLNGERERRDVGDQIVADECARALGDKGRAVVRYIRHQRTVVREMLRARWADVLRVAEHLDNVGFIFSNDELRQVLA